jgi:hypothetical protein
MKGRRGISCDARFDDARYYQFSRSSGLPVGYFRRERAIHPIWLLSSILLAFLVLLIVF